jgi:uncharacterized coiled-coil protein SlyX
MDDKYLTIIVALVCALITATTAFLVAYWHRKQMRQIELFRVDQSAGLIAPPSPPVAFLKKHRDLILGIVVPLLTLTGWLAWTWNSPVTTISVLIITFNLFSIFGTLRLQAQWVADRKLLNSMDEHVALTKRITETVDEHWKLLYAQADQIEALTSRLASMETQAEVATPPSVIPPTPSGRLDSRAP